MRRGLALIACGLGLLAAGGPAAGQDRSSIQLRNSSFERVFVIAYDNVCRRRVFEGRIVRSGSISVAACLDRRGKASLTVYDINGRRKVHKNLGKLSVVQVRVR